jgi:hypothetical protein
MALAEVGMKIIGGGLSQSETSNYLWAKGVEKEVRYIIFLSSST